MVLRENFGRTELISMAMKEYLGGLELIPVGSNSSTQAESRFSKCNDDPLVDIDKAHRQQAPLYTQHRMAHENPL
ncbi:hypothetical protein WN48_07667 [Eufriesea mexicana]|nr:hypothetical protein WN48_07667 [Eufriesea mexicana]